jgi:hypothetical protein
MKSLRSSERESAHAGAGLTLSWCVPHSDDKTRSMTVLKHGGLACAGAQSFLRDRIYRTALLTALWVLFTSAHLFLSSCEALNEDRDWRSLVTWSSSAIDAGTTALRQIESEPNSACGRKACGLFIRSSWKANGCTNGGVGACQIGARLAHMHVLCTESQQSAEVCPP